MHDWLTEIEEAEISVRQITVDINSDERERNYSQCSLALSLIQFSRMGNSFEKRNICMIECHHSWNVFQMEKNFIHIKYFLPFLNHQIYRNNCRDWDRDGTNWISLHIVIYYIDIHDNTPGNWKAKKKEERHIVIYNNSAKNKMKRIIFAWNLK